MYFITKTMTFEKHEVKSEILNVKLYTIDPVNRYNDSLIIKYNYGS